MNQIGTKIQTLRKNKSVTQAQLADVLSVSAQSVSKWENGISSPDISLLPMIARYFGVTMDELFNYRLDALNYKERFIRFMADNNVLQFGEFRLQSGRVSPYYIDTGRCRSASQIAKLGAFYAECMQENNIEANVLLCNTNREIPVMLAASMVLFKKYGIDIHYSIDDTVGKSLEESDRVILIKDTLTSGRTLKANLDALCHGTVRPVTNVVVSVDRMERGDRSARSAKREIEQKYGAKVYAIVTVDDIIRAVEKGIVGSREHMDALKQYRATYIGE